MNWIGLWIGDDEYVPSDDECEKEDSYSSRLNNLEWCSCSKCSSMESSAECRCCKEFADLLGEKLTNNTCITENEYFELVFLQKPVLETAYMQNRHYNKKYSNMVSISNKSYRFTGYRQYTAWVHYFERLGHWRRVVIPSCVVNKIRSNFPSEDGTYTGFRYMISNLLWFNLRINFDICDSRRRTHSI